MSSKSPDGSYSSRFRQIRNISIIAHIDAGKTTLTEHFLFYSGKNYRIGEVDSGNTVMDYLDEERSRGITIVSAAATLEWTPSCGGTPHLLHLIDTPGHIDFTAEVERSLRVIDGAIVVFSGVEGVQAQSEKVWRQSDAYKVAKIAFVNKLDRTGASFTRVLGEIRDKFKSAAALPLQMPVGMESELKGVIDLVAMKALLFEGENGERMSAMEIPGDLLEEAARARIQMLDELANFSEPVLELRLEDKDVPADLLKGEIRRAALAGKIVPVFCGSAKRNIGIQPVIDAVCSYLPSPEDRSVYEGINPKTKDKVEVRLGDSAFSGLVFKVIASGSADLLYMRTYSGTIRLNDTLLNTRTGEKVRIKRLLRLYAKNVEPVDEVGAGDIVGIIGPANTFTGDTLCAVNRPVLLEKISFPEPVISMAVEPKSNKDKERLETCLQLLCREDPTLNMARNESTGQLILSGMGELHLEINSNRIMNEFNLQVRFGIPQVAFRETITAPSEILGSFNRTIGEQIMAADVLLSLEPAPRLESGIEVSASLRNKAAVPKAWLAAALETLGNGLRTGGNWGYPLIYIRAAVLDIKSPDDKTAESAVAGAVLDGLQKAIAKGTAILEPIVKVEIMCPENVLGDISGYLQARRAVIHGLSDIAGMKHLICEVPLSEMFGFSKALPKLSSGRASFSMEPCGYQEISSADLERISQRSTRQF